MKSYVWLTFAFMGWAYYEISGGSDFEPVQTVIAVVEQAEPEIVTRANSPTLLAVSSSNIAPQSQDTDIMQALTDAVALDSVEAEPEIVAVVAPVVEPEELDIRAVKGSRVNMRMGPGTGFDVIMTLDGGTKLEILEIDADGWANVSTVDRGIEGWMAARLLTDPKT